MTEICNPCPHIRITDLFSATPIRSFGGGGHSIRIETSLGDLSFPGTGLLPEIIAIQRLITLSHLYDVLVFEWDALVAQTFFSSPAIFPLLSISLCLDNAVHKIQGIENQAFVDGSEKASIARKNLLAYRMKIDSFMDCQILLCADTLGRGFHPDLYTKSGVLNDTEGMEAFVDDLLIHHLVTGTNQSSTYRLREALGVIVSELFENTELHGKRNLEGGFLAKNSLRGIVIKRVERQAKSRSEIGQRRDVLLEYLEISIFDSGVGFYSSYTGNKLDSSVPLADEWKVMHHCLQRHHDKNISDSRLEHRGMGLYEVLRALMAAKGLIEIRSGRAYAYRTFLEGDMRMQLESKDSFARPGMPKPILLDADRKFVTVPTEHEQLVGAAVRVLFPLK